MDNSILFIGQFDDNMLSLEAKIIEFDKTLDEKDNFLVEKKKSLANPDVIKYKINGYDFNAWIFIGNVKPTVLLKSLISKVKIILFVFNLSNLDTLNFLSEGWGYIFDQISLKNEQQRFLIGTQTISNENRQKIIQKIQETMEKYKCHEYFEEKIAKNMKLNGGKFIVHSDIYKTLQKLFLKGKPIEKTIENNNKTKKSDKKKSNQKDKKSNEKNQSKKELIDFEEEEIDSCDYFDEQKFKDEENILFKDINSVQYKLFKQSQIAEIVESPKSKGDVFIPTFVSYRSKQYKIVHVSDKAFANTNITSLSFTSDSKIKSFGNSIFENSEISELLLPYSLLKVDNYWCKDVINLNKIDVDSKSKRFMKEKCFLVTKEKEENCKKVIFTKKILFAPRNISDVSIPEGTATIEPYAFSYLQKLKSLNIECSSLKEIKSYSFYQCKSLKKIIIKKSSQLTIGDFCFSKNKNLEYVELDCDSISIGDHCFSECSSLSIIKFLNTKAITIYSQAFIECPKLNEFSANEVENVTIVVKNENLESNEIIFNFINNCPSILSLTINSNENINILSKSFNNESLKKIKINSSSKLALKNSKFNQTNLEIVELNADDIDIDFKCFQDCDSLDSLIVQSNKDIQINESNFFVSKSLKILKLTTNSNINLNRQFDEDFVESIILSGNDVIISENCFKSNSNIKKLEINSKYSHLSASSFEDCNILEKIIIKAESKIIIQNRCFHSCSKLNSIDFECSDLSVEEFCFSKCSSIKSLTFQDFNRIIFDENAFNECNELEKIEINSKIFHLGKLCFSNSSKINSIQITSATKISICEECFKNCSSISDFSLQDVKEVFLGKNVFSGCTQLKTIQLKAGNQITFDCSCFEKNESVESVEISCYKVDIKDSCFYKCRSLSSVNINDSTETFLGNSAFKECYMLSNVKIKSKNILISEKCFKKCKILKPILCFSAEKIEIKKKAFKKVPGKKHLEYH